MSDWQKFWSIVKDYYEVIVVVHEKPDGDCLGSALSLCSALERLGKSPCLLLPEPLPAIYEFLPGQEVIRFQDAGRLPEDALVVAVDCADKNRIKYELNDSNYVINIDHHISNEMFGGLNIVNPAAAAAGEILYNMFLEGGISLTPEMATCLYVAVSTDTGSFTFSNTTAAVLNIASELVKQKADLEQIRFNLHEKRPLKELLTIKAALGNLQISGDGKIISSLLSYEDLAKDDLFSAETDGLIGMLRATEGVELAILFKETEPVIIKVSLRSKSYVDVNELAKEFAGGGHSRAAGCTIRGDLKIIADTVLAAARRYVEGRNENGRGH